MRPFTPPTIALSSQRRSAARLDHCNAWHAALGKLFVTAASELPSAMPLASYAPAEVAASRKETSREPLHLASSLRRKHFSSWSFTMPTACMNA